MELHYLSQNPYQQFHDWFQEAKLKSSMQHPNAMALATASPDGIPSVRMVLLKGVSERGFVFFTNYESRKGQELEANPKAALCFYWDSLQKQVRVEGKITRLSREESQSYFQSRPRGSQLGAWASHQSKEIPSRDYLEASMLEMEQKFHQIDPIPVPDYWGGFLLDPHSIEFWLGQNNRLHDRFLYRRRGADWTIHRLSP